jgi:hypothetical protein
VRKKLDAPQRHGYDSNTHEREMAEAEDEVAYREELLTALDNN